MKSYFLFVAFGLAIQPSECPQAAAKCNGVAEPRPPSSRQALTGAPAASSARTAPAFPSQAATCSGVKKRSGVHAESSAPAPVSTRTTSAASCSAAVCSGVYPRPSLAAASAPAASSSPVISAPLTSAARCSREHPRASPTHRASPPPPSAPAVKAVEAVAIEKNRGLPSPFEPPKGKGMIIC